MTGLGVAVRFLTNPLAVAALGFVSTVGAYNVGLIVGDKRGTAEAEARQEAVNAEQAAEIRERVRDVLDEIGASFADDDVDRILRGLAGDP
jgi:hypothetical protein